MACDDESLHCELWQSAIATTVVCCSVASATAYSGLWGTYNVVAAAARDASIRDLAAHEELLGGDENSERVAEELQSTGELSVDQSFERRPFIPCSYRKPSPELFIYLLII